MKEGVVIKTTGSWYYVLSERNVYPCKLKGKFRIKGIRATNPVAVGDNVLFETQHENTGIITAIRERKNYLIRKSSKLSKEYQLIASNIDKAWLMVSLLKPRTYPEFIDRFLVTTEAYNIPAAIIYNKTDLYTQIEFEELELMTHVYRSAGYEVFHTSALQKESVAPLLMKMKNKLNVFSGNSGVGKSSLINLMDPALNLKTGVISDAHMTGKHTTTFAEMHSLSFGGFVVDTPGIRGFGLIDFDKNEIFHFFPEIFKKSHECRFHNCTHIHEPGCAVIKAVGEGDIYPGRYESYLSLMADTDEKYR